MSSPVTILLVEDDKEMLDGTADWLESMPTRYEMSVMKASHGKMALELMASRVPDLIVSDIMMPEMGGYEFLSEVRKNSEWVHIPFIFLSAKGKEGDIRKGQLSDADLYLTKPFKATELTELIQTQLDRSFDRKKIRTETLGSLKKNMLQILNHEFRTPLTYVTAYYDMLESNQDGRNAQEYLRGIQAGCLRLTSLVSDLILIVELRSGEAAKKYQERATICRNLSKLISAAIVNKSMVATENKVEVNYFNAGTVLPDFVADPVALEAVFERILDNAIKFSCLGKEDKREVTITTAVDDHALRIAFKDTGLGVPDYMHDRIFELFEQHNRNLIEQQGAGTGLTIANELIMLHGGRIEVESEEDSGSTFTVVLPIYTNEKLPASRRNGRRRATILLVEDDENLLYGLQDLLLLFDGKYELDVHTAVNGKMGLQVMQTVTPDLIVSDIMMPEMDGYQFLKAVRTNPEWLDIPFIYLTAKGEKRDEIGGYVLGVEVYMTKPYESDDALILIEKQLDKHFLSQQRIIEDFEDLKQVIVNLITPEFMQPLTSVSLHTTKLAKLAEDLKTIDTREDFSESLRKIQDGGLRLNRLIEDFITLAELETGEAAVSHNWQAQPISNIGLLLFELVQAMNHQSYPEAQINCPFNDQVPLIFGDSSVLVSCVERLLLFCIEQSPPGAEAIILSVSSAEGEVHISITSFVPMFAESEKALLSILENDTVNLNGVPESVDAATLFIAKGHVGLHNGRVAFKHYDENGFVLTITLPVYVSQPDSTS